MHRTRRHRWACVLAVLVLSADGRFVRAAANATTTSGAARAFGLQPLTFIENRGQEDGNARFSLTSSGQTIWFGDDQIVFDLNRTRQGDQERLVFRQTLLGASRTPRLEAGAAQPGVHHFLIGNDPRRWRAGVKGFGELRYLDVYPGIDVRLYGKGRALEQEFVVQPGAEAGQIRVAYDGVEEIRVGAVDTVDGSPTRLAPRVGATEVNDTSLFGLGMTAVTFRFADESGNVGEAASAVTVEIGVPALALQVIGHAWHAPGILAVDVQLKNRGTGHARRTRLQRLEFKTLNHHGAVSLNRQLSPQLPLALGDLDVGAGVTVRLYLNVPATARRFSISAVGTMLDVAGAKLKFSSAQAVIPGSPLTARKPEHRLTLVADRWRPRKGLTMRPGELTELLRSWRDGDRAALDRVMPVVYDELRSLAARQLATERPGHTLQTTALVHEAYLRLAGQQQTDWNTRAHFFGAVAVIMRRILVDHARRRARGKRGGDLVIVPLASAPEPAADAVTSVDVEALDRALDRLASIDARQSRIVELRYFSGMTLEEIAEVMALSTGTVKRDWTVARAWLFAELGSPGPRPSSSEG
jgi:RNA polymerase sigma factor (TIGR02999 family)